MDMEAIFLNWFSIKKKPDNILDLIEMAIGVAELKYPAKLEKRRNRIIKTLLHPGRLHYVDDEEDDEASTLDDEEYEVGDEDEVTNIEKEEKQQITTPTNQKPTTKIKLIIKKNVQVAPLEEHNKYNEIEQLKKRSETYLADKQSEADKQGTRQSHNATTMGSRKWNMPTQVTPPPPHEKLLLSDFSFEKQLDGDKPLKKQSHKGFKKMECLTGDKREEQKECTSGLTKSMALPLMKINNVATKCVQVAPAAHQKQLISNGSPKKQSNFSAITRPMRKEIGSIRDSNMKFESSKRKFEERFEEQREAKRRIVMVDFHDMPKPPNDSRAPRRHCWNRRF
ncbi:unnamed protein product [Withania somnifera]